MQNVTKLLADLQQQGSVNSELSAFLPLVKQLEAIVKTLPNLFVDYRKEVECQASV